jgi:YesN/AraC family two-component response regulator
MDVLWIDDEIDRNDLLIRELESESYVVDCVPSGREGLERARGKCYDLIVADVRLPDMYGPVLVDRIRRGGCLTPILVITGHYLDDEVFADALQRGANHFTYKPLDLHTVAALLETVIISSGSGAQPNASVSSRNTEDLLAATASIDTRVKSIMVGLVRHPDCSMTAEALAESVKLSGSRLRHLWRQGVGVPLATFRKNTRLDNAAQLLRGTYRSVAHIASAVGFTDLRYFERAFRNRFDVSPSAFRGEKRGRPSNSRTCSSVSATDRQTVNR